MRIKLILQIVFSPLAAQLTNLYSCVCGS